MTKIILTLNGHDSQINARRWTEEPFLVPVRFLRYLGVKEDEGGVGPGPEVGLHHLLGQHHPAPGLQGACGESEQVSRGGGGRGS